MKLSIINKTLFGLVILVFLSSCRLGKEYQRPDLKLPAKFDSVGKQSFGDTSSIADIDWKTFFIDPKLQELIEKALQHNNDLQVAIRRMDIAGLLVTQSKALSWPEVDAQVSGSINRPSDNSLTGLSIKSFLGKSYVENYDARIMVSWEIDVWGKIRGQKEVALTEYLRSGEARKAVQTRLVSDIAKEYFNLLMLDRQLEIARENLTWSDSFVVATRLLKDAGLGTALAVQRAESQRLTTALLIPQIEQSIVESENFLKTLTGEYPGTIDRNVGLDDIRITPDLTTGLPAAMVSRRPDVRVAELSLVSANAQIGIEKANMYPMLNLAVGTGLESFKASNWFNIPGSLFGLGAGTIAQPIFRRKALRTRYEISKVEREIAVNEFRQSVLQASSEVVTALSSIEKLKQQEQLAKMQTDTLRSAIRNAQLLFKSDMADYLEVITAQANALIAELNLASIQRQQLDAIVELYRSLGGGWR
jgi:multidrug efflux system outer membrane protein